MGRNKQQECHHFYFFSKKGRERETKLKLLNFDRGQGQAKWKPSQKVVRGEKHNQRKKSPVSCELPGFALTPFIPLRIHIGSSSTRKKLHSFSYSSRSSILRVMYFLWGNKTKAKQMVGFTHTHTSTHMLLSLTSRGSGSLQWQWRGTHCHTSLFYVCKRAENLCSRNLLVWFRLVKKPLTKLALHSGRAKEDLILITTVPVFYLKHKSLNLERLRQFIQTTYKVDKGEAWALFRRSLYGEGMCSAGSPHDPCEHIRLSESSPRSQNLLLILFAPYGCSFSREWMPERNYNTISSQPTI